MPAPDAINIVLVDDHAILRGGLRLLLQREEGLHVVGEAQDAEGAIRLAASRRPDVVVLDLNLPGGSGLEALPGIREASPETKVVVLTMQKEADYARLALQAGANAYVLKESADVELLAAIRHVVAGGTYLHPELGAQLALQRLDAQRPDDLTERELEILRLLALGHTNQEIAGQLFLSVRTIEAYRSTVQSKLGRTTRAELVQYALEHGLLQP